VVLRVDAAPNVSFYIILAYWTVALFHRDADKRCAVFLKFAGWGA
jgi:hypothetical protein